jgi:hypothetical protein
MNVLTNPFESKWWIGPRWNCDCGCKFTLSKNDKVKVLPITHFESMGEPTVHVICPCCGVDCRAGKAEAEKR